MARRMPTNNDTVSTSDNGWTSRGDPIQLEKSFAHRARSQIEPMLFVTFTSKGANELQAAKRLDHSLGEDLRLLPLPATLIRFPWRVRC